MRLADRHSFFRGSTHPSWNNIPPFLNSNARLYNSIQSLKSIFLSGFLLSNNSRKALVIISWSHQIKETEIPGCRSETLHLTPSLSTTGVHFVNLSMYCIESPPGWGPRKSGAYRFYRFFPPRVLSMSWSTKNSTTPVHNWFLYQENKWNCKQWTTWCEHFNTPKKQEQIEGDWHVGIEENQIFIPWSVSLWLWYYTKNTGKRLTLLGNPITIDH
jgi:hypothetical protein